MIKNYFFLGGIHVGGEDYKLFNGYDFVLSNFLRYLLKNLGNFVNGSVWIEKRVI